MHPAIDRYAHLDSPIHRWDPRWKLAGHALLLGAIALAPLPAARAVTWDRDVPQALVALAAGLALVEMSRIPLRFAFRRLLPALFFLGVFVLVYPLGVAGGAAGGGVSYSRQGLLAAGLIAVRAVAILLLVLPMFGTSRFDETMKALRALRVPGPFVQLAVFAYRYIYVYADELGRMRAAMRARGFHGRPFLHAARTAGNALGMLLVRSVERTQGIHEAMAARGYRGAFRTLDDFATRPRDVLKTAAAGAAAAVLAVWSFLP